MPYAFQVDFTPGLHFYLETTLVTQEHFYPNCAEIARQLAFIDETLDLFSYEFQEDHDDDLEECECVVGLELEAPMDALRLHDDPQEVIWHNRSVWQSGGNVFEPVPAIHGDLPGHFDGCTKASIYRYGKGTLERVAKAYGLTFDRGASKPTMVRTIWHYLGAGNPWDS